MSRKPQAPELKKYMDKLVHVSLKGGYEVTGTVSGYDQFMNIVLKHCAREIKTENGTETEKIDTLVIRGNANVIMEALEKIDVKM